MDGGLVQDVRIAGGACRILVRDFDIEGAQPEGLEETAHGVRLAASRWGAWPDDPTAAAAHSPIPAADPGDG